MKLSLHERKKIKLFAKRLIEARDDTFAEYEIKKDKVIAYVSKQKGGAYTKLADEWTKFKNLEIELADKKRKLNDELKVASIAEEDLKNKIREKVISIFDESEQAMSLAVKCLNSSFTVSKMTEENRDIVTARKGDYIDTDHQKVVELLLEQLPDLQEQINTIIKQCSTIAVEDIIKAGRKRRVGVDTNESLMTEGLWDKIVSVFNRLSQKFAALFNTAKRRQAKIDALLASLKQKGSN